MENGVLISLWLPILLCAIALFLASFLSWMVVQLHKNDWKKLSNEDAFMSVAANSATSQAAVRNAQPRAPNTTACGNARA